jgi:hypothetical protein
MTNYLNSRRLLTHLQYQRFLDYYLLELKAHFGLFIKLYILKLKFLSAFLVSTKGLLHGLGLAEYCNLLELANNIRNALVHNNGYHNKVSVCVRWKYLTVEFIEGKIL